jgi:DNA-binding CsgD family transcriptional regulator
LNVALAFRWLKTDPRLRRLAGEKDFFVLSGLCATSSLPVGQHGRHKLTPRQLQVLDYLLEGDGEKQVAYRLSISVHTVHTHVRHIYRAYQVQSRTELLARFVQRTDRRASLGGNAPLLFILQEAIPRQGYEAGGEEQRVGAASLRG